MSPRASHDEVDGYRAANAELAAELRAVRQTLAELVACAETVADELMLRTDGPRDWIDDKALAMMLRAALPVADDDRSGL